MVIAIPVEIARLIAEFLEDNGSLLNFLLVSRTFYHIAKPLLYTEVSLLGPIGEVQWDQHEGRSDADLSTMAHGFLSSIVANCEFTNFVKRIRLPAVAFRREQYPVFQTIMKSVPNLEDLEVHSSWWREGMIPFNLRTFLEGTHPQSPPIPFSLKSFAWYTREVQPDGAGLEWFLRRQRDTLERLHLPYLRISDQFPDIPVLSRLRVLHASTVDVARMFNPKASQITHLMLELVNRGEFDEAVLRNVVVWVTRISAVDIISEAVAQMSNLEYLEIDTFYSTIPNILSRMDAFAGATRLRHLRIFTTDFDQLRFGKSNRFDHHPWNYNDISKAFESIPSLIHISIRLVPAATYPEFYCFTRGTPRPAKIRSLRPGMPESASYEWWHDWTDDHTTVPFEPNDPRLGYRSDSLPHRHYPFR